MRIAEPSQTTVLLQRLRSGDRVALAALFDYYRPRLRQMLRLRMNGRLAARIDASDVLKETYFDAARQIESYLRQPQVAVYIWLRGLAWERLLNLQRQHPGAKCRAAARKDLLRSAHRCRRRGVSPPLLPFRQPPFSVPAKILSHAAHSRNSEETDAYNDFRVEVDKP